MTEPAFPSHISAALDRLTVPPLPVSFHEDLIARLENGELPAEPDVLTPLPSLRVPSLSGRGWRRSGKVFAIVASFGLATATAAASGIFGDPVYVPVVSNALAEAKLVELPKKAAKKPTVAKVAPWSEESEKPAAESEPTGQEAVSVLITKLTSDAAFKDLPRRERAELMRGEIARLIESGKANRSDVKAALAQRRQERQAQRQIAQFQKEPSALKQRQADREKFKKPLPRPKLTPAQKEKVREVHRQLSPEQLTELRGLRQRLRVATPQEKRAVRAEIRAFWQRAGLRPPLADANGPNEAKQNDFQP